MKFSVLMSLYNKESPDFLNECLSSLNDQVLNPDEIIIVYDGDVGEKLECIVNNWLDLMPIKVLKLPASVGLGQALNAGLEVCTNDIICRMDTDDICVPNRFHIQINYLKTHADISLVGSNVIEFSSSKKSEGKLKAVPSEHRDIFDFAKKRNPFNHMSVTFKKSIINEAGGYQHHLYMEDYNLWLRVLAKGYKVHNIPEPLVYARTGSNMIRRRHGFSYVKSELQLAKLKAQLGIQSSLEAFGFFLLRSIPRILPLSILTAVYAILRNNK